MSAGGLLARAVLGATHGAATGIGERLREESKLKRRQALEQTRTTETMKRQAHNTALQRGTNEQTHGQALERQKAQNEDARGRLVLQDELGETRYQDVTDANGRIIGQREVDSNQYTPFTTKPASDLTDRQKYQIESLNSEIESIYKSAESLGGTLTPEQQDRLDTLTLQRNSMLYGGGGSSTILSDLMSGEGGSGSPAGDDGDQPEASEPQGIRGQLSQRVSGQEQQSKNDGVQAQVDTLEKEVDTLLSKVDPDLRSGALGMPGGGLLSTPTRKQPLDEQDIAKAQELVQRFIALDENPETSGALSERQRAAIVQRIMDLQRAGVPINLDTPKKR